VALRDQALQVIVGRVHRHATHGNVIFQMFAALGQGDVERAGGNFGILEKQFVEIAHPVE